MPRQPSQLLPQATSKVDLKAGESPRSTDQLKADLPPERPLTLRPGTKLPNGKRVPPPPPPKGTLMFQSYRSPERCGQQRRGVRIVRLNRPAIRQRDAERRRVSGRR